MDCLDHPSCLPAWPRRPRHLSRMDLLALRHQNCLAPMSLIRLRWYYHVHRRRPILLTLRLVCELIPDHHR